MYKLLCKSCISFFFSISLIIYPVTAFSDQNSFGYRIFEIQKKHALQGSRLAQYKLGTFYEFGISVKSNEKEAAFWYEKSAKKRYKPAKNRLIYLDIKHNGYNKSKHNSWVKNIKDESRKANVHSTIILGQLNHYGLGVKQDLPAAFALLRSASARGYAEIDFEIDEISNKIGGKNATKNTSAGASTTFQLNKTESKKSIPKEKLKAVSTPKPQSKPKPVANLKTEAKPKSKAAVKHKKKVKKTLSEDDLIKRKKYNDAIRKQYEEQLILQQQQNWSEDD